MTPLLQEMLSEMRQHLSADDIRAGLPENSGQVSDISPLYGDWNTLCKNEQRQLSCIRELDDDIQRMEPWGDYPVARVDQLAQRGLSLLFWRCTRNQYDAHRMAWVDDYQAELVSERNGYCYFVTITPQGARIVLPEAESITITPSPVSTLIMLQTRAKDSLRRTQLEMGDFSMQHYREIESALGLTDTLKLPSRHRRFLRRLGRIFRKR